MWAGCQSISENVEIFTVLLVKDVSDTEIKR